MIPSKTASKWSFTASPVPAVARSKEPDSSRFGGGRQEFDAIADQTNPL